MSNTEVSTVDNVQVVEYYYTYLIIDTAPHTEAEFYIGSRRTRNRPSEDTLYMGSVKSKKWRADWKTITQRSDKIVLEEFESYEKALAHEVALHKEYNVDKNPKFYNEAKQTSSKFCYDATGTKRPDTSALMKGNTYGKLVVYTPERREKISKSRQGFKSYQAIKTNIYNYTTGELVAGEVCLNEWCKANNINQGNLWKTKRKQDGTSIRKSHNNLYIKDVNNDR